MKNVNKILENSVRSELLGKNMMTIARKYHEKGYWSSTNPYSFARKSQQEMGDCNVNNIWEKPMFSLSGIFCMGHQTDIENVLQMQLIENEKPLEFIQVRNHWTPAWMDTHYRSEPELDYYTKSGCICVREKKCITRDDVFISCLSISNDKSEPVNLQIKFNCAFEMNTNRVYDAKAKILAGALREDYSLHGYFVVGTETDEYDIIIEANSCYKFKYAAAFSPNSSEEADALVTTSLNYIDPFTNNETIFNEWFNNNVPELSTDDSDILKAYYYRWFLVYKNTFSPKDAILEHFVIGDSVYECTSGPGYSCPIGLSIPLQSDEIKWMRKPEIAYSHLLNWKNGKGNYRVYIQYTPLSIWMTYVHYRDLDFLEDMYVAMKEFTLKKYREGKLPVTNGSWLTGAEYQPSFYQHTKPEWDWRYDIEGQREWGFERSRLYRLDEIVFLIASLMGCAYAAKELGEDGDYDFFINAAEKIKHKLKTDFWNKQDGIFYDIDEKTGLQCDKAACYDSFMPLMWGIVDDDEYLRCFDKLFDNKWFWGDYPIATVSKNCPMYWFDNCIAGPCESSPKEPHHYGCCWNGTVWPFANSMVLEALGISAKKHTKYQMNWIEFFQRYTELHFPFGDRSTPVIFEQYRITDGITFSNASDYFHSCWIDLFMKYWVGISIEEGVVAFKPFTDREFKLQGVTIAGKVYNFKQEKKNGKVISTMYCE